MGLSLLLVPNCFEMGLSLLLVPNYFVTHLSLFIVPDCSLLDLPLFLFPNWPGRDLPDCFLLALLHIVLGCLVALDVQHEPLEGPGHDLLGEEGHEDDGEEDDGRPQHSAPVRYHSEHSNLHMKVMFFSLLFSQFLSSFDILNDLTDLYCML